MNPEIIKIPIKKNKPTIPQVHIYECTDFIKELTDRIAQSSFIDSLKMSGLYSTPLDNRAAMYMLGVKSAGAINRYCTLGKKTPFGYKKLKKQMINNRPSYKLGDVLIFRRI